MMILTNYIRRIKIAAASVVALNSLVLTSSMAGTLLESPSAPEPQPSALDFITKAKLTADFRLRYEYGEQDPLDKSHAGTLRGRSGILSGKVAGFQAFAEYEGTLAADRDSYQAASVHGTGQGKTIIADPESHELNQAWLSWSGGDTTAKVGRQRIILDNARFVGNVGWRQNEQTYDAVTLTNSSIDNLKLFYGYINHTQRIFGSETPALAGQTDFDGDTQLFNVAYSGLPNATIATYAYLMDLENDAGSAASNHTFGNFIKGTVPSAALGYYAEYARQTDGGSSPLSYEANYYHLKLDKTFAEKHTVGVGYECLGEGFQTPLATLHAFNGYADMFLSTPADGLADVYVFAGTKLPGDVGLKVAYHWYGSEGGSLEYGSEANLVLSKKVTENATLLAMYANYFADDFATDTQRLSVEMSLKF